MSRDSILTCTQGQFACGKKERHTRWDFCSHINSMGIRRKLTIFASTMMTSSNEYIFRVTGPLCGEFTDYRWIPLTEASDDFFDLHLTKRLSIQSWCWWFETPLRPLWCHCNDSVTFIKDPIWVWSHMRGKRSRRIKWKLILGTMSWKWCTFWELHVSSKGVANGPIC